ncbi:hypothetical protein [Kitasatospora sp. NPDC091207]|uniref:hypothetical protein n=1 Tax=Kitasatospora sp. NPDC091207 TaxID=3364083 RepID=UPI00382E1742
MATWTVSGHASAPARSGAAGPMASAVKGPAPPASAALPRRSRTATITRQAVGVLKVARTGAGRLEASDLGTLLRTTVDAPVGGVDVDERDLVRARQQWRRPGQSGKEVPVHRVELPVVAVREGAQGGTQRRRCALPAEQQAQRAVPQPVGVVDGGISAFMSGPWTGH